MANLNGSTFFIHPVENNLLPTNDWAEILSHISMKLGQFEEVEINLEEKPWERG